jgi:5-formyltetrahydrofolate cyclo-ligase
VADSLSPSPKPALRAALRRRRRALAAANPEAAALAAGHLRLGRLPPFRVVAGYQPVGGEMNPGPVLDRLTAAGAALALPAVESRDGPAMFRSAERPEAFVPDALGVLSPPPGAPALIPDLIVAPVLAFDSRGGRLGQGGGIYDRALAARRAAGPVFVIGLAFAGQEVDAVPLEAHDQPLDAILTECGYIEVRKDSECG